MSVKILSCGTLMSVGSCYLLCMLAIYVVTESSCIWVRNGVEILFLCYSSTFECHWVVIKEKNNNRNGVLSRSLHQYGPKYS